MKNAVLISCFDWFDTRLKPIKAELEDRGYIVTILTSDYDHIKKERINKKNQNCSYISVKAYKRNVSFDRMYSHYLFAKEISNRLNTIRPDLVYALVPPNSVTYACSKYKRKYPDIRLIFDLIDMWPESMPGKTFHSTFPFRYWKNLRDKSLVDADHIFTECSLYQEKLDSYVRNKCSTLSLFKEDNGFFVESNEEINLEDNSIKPIIKLCYLGSINHIIDIDGICNVVKKIIQEYSVEVRIIGKGENTDFFLDSLKRTGASIMYYGPVYDETEKFNLLRECDYALNMMVETVIVGLTVKSIDYLSYGLPLINNIKGDTWQLVEKEKIGINYNENLNLVKMIQEQKLISHFDIYKLYRKLYSKEAFLESFRRGIENV